ncbi:MAG: DNA polymerase III subunit gamma/tau, partial [Gammaproteobacteria bacterium]|nr:DNA polymerase III subunit gamma/tau [Gammaproteobacteria bacterium]
MSYQVLARKWRPQNFQELVGQEHVQRALVNALNDDRLHHAYLFTGTRGVGKTTIARIFSKSLNCETGITSTPCGQCSTCLEIAEGRYVDLIEVDAASRTGVDDTRDLLENVQYAPTRGRYKVYLIDEVHMFSKSSFNALLKTLEEPPPHVKFLLATTDPQKLPVTILSRCLQFNLKRLPVSLIISHLQHILTEEKVEFNVTALQLIAEAADGSMRDALSLLDQALAFGGGSIMEEEVRDMLGSVSRDKVIRLLTAVLQRDAAQTMAVVAELAELSPDFENVLTELLSLLHHMSLAKTVPEALDEFVSAREELLKLCEEVSAEDLHLFYQIALIGRRDLPLSPDARNGFEMIMLRLLAFRPAGVDAGRMAQNQAQPAVQSQVQSRPQAAPQG